MSHSEHCVLVREQALSEVATVVRLENGRMELADEDYERCHFSVSCETRDLAVLHCLRSLSQHAEGSKIPKSIPWGGTKEAAWRRDDYVATFRFTSPDYRETFLSEVERLLPTELWREVARSDADPATRRR